MLSLVIYVFLSPNVIRSDDLFLNPNYDEIRAGFVPLFCYEYVSIRYNPVAIVDTDEIIFVLLRLLAALLCFLVSLRFMFCPLYFPDG